MLRHRSVAATLAVAAGLVLPQALGGQGATTLPTPVLDPSWLHANTATETATFELVAGLTGLNGALNFNGFRDGELTLIVPVGWKVMMHFRNHDGMLPHSAEVIPDIRPIPLGPVPPAFPGAVTVRLGEGLISEGRDDIVFIADKGGSYLIFCGVPGHGAAGMWIRLEVAASARKPSLAVTPAGR